MHMPIYEYECHDCGREFEKVVRFAEADQPQVCPDCKSENTKKKVSVFASFGGLSSGGGGSGGSCGSGGGFT
jgi:putative FmdB family regulatory protein